MKPKIQKLFNKIAKLQAEVTKLQESCKHKNVTVKLEANTGNFCQEDNIYWIVVNCLDCGKYMSFDSKRDRENYHKYLKQ